MHAALTSHALRNGGNPERAPQQAVPCFYCRTLQAAVRSQVVPTGLLFIGHGDSRLLRQQSECRRTRKTMHSHEAERLCEGAHLV